MSIDVRDLDKAAKEYKGGKRAWTSEELNVLTKYYGRVPVNLLAKKLNRSVSAVQMKVLRTPRTDE